jgi:hypothetical protein
MTVSRRRRRWDLVVLSLGAISAAISILFSGWFIVWFQLFGEQPDGADYAEASGLYAGGLIWLGLASLVAWLAGAPRWLRWWCWVATGLFAILLLSARQSAAGAELPPSGLKYDNFGSGFEGAMLGMPWNWLVLVSLVLALVHRTRERGTTTSPGAA